MNFAVVIPSRVYTNLQECLASLFIFDPVLANEPERIIVVDDGLEEQLPGITYLPGLKPFVFSRNVNIGVRHALQILHVDTVIIMNDDATLCTVEGMQILAKLAWVNASKYGVLSASIFGSIANPEQEANIRKSGIIECSLHPMVAFICVAISREVVSTVGLLDEQFTDYGYDDDDYCRRVLKMGLKLGVCHNMIVSHGKLPSTYRRLSLGTTLDANRARFEAKWKVKK